MSNKFNCFLIGEESLLLRCSEILLNNGNKILGIISNNRNIAKWASEKEINLFKPDFSVTNIFESQPYEYLFSIANLSILPASIISTPSKMAINFHDGPLPKYAGINTPSWALLNNEKTYGITWHLMTSGIDDGAILNQTTFDITADETAFTLNAKCYEAGANSFYKLIDDLESGAYTETQQVPENKTYFAKYKKPESVGVIAWNKSAQEISALVRALNFGQYPNPLASAKVMINGKTFIVKGAKVSDSIHHTNPGMITDFDSESITISAKTGLVVLHDFETINGKKISVDEILSKNNLRLGSSLDELSDSLKKNLTTYYSEVCRHESYFVKILKHLEPIDIPFKSDEIDKKEVYHHKQIKISEKIKDYINSSAEYDLESFIKAAFCLFIGKVQGKDFYDIGYCPDPLVSGTAPFESIFALTVPMHIDINYSNKVSEQIISALESINKVSKARTYIYDLIARTPELQSSGVDYSSFPVIIRDGNSFDPNYNQNSKLILFYSNTEKQFYLEFNENYISHEQFKKILEQFDEFLINLISNQDKNFYEISLLTAEEKNTLLKDWNNTKMDYDNKVCIHQLFEEQVRIKPKAIAVACNGHQITYNELNKKSNQLANYLSSKGIEANVFVGISLSRSIDMMVAILGVLKAGGAYVPIDPQFPKDRTTFMIEDSECPLVITESSLKNYFESTNSKFIYIDTEWEKICNTVDSNSNDHTSSNLAYAIYTSGSTGKPKGVMVNHRNVVNFFTGMDQHINYDESSVWLAVTSLSFDISVLELLWTLTRGLKVVLYTADDIKVSVNQEKTITSSAKIDFSLFYFSSYEGEKSQNKYKLLIEGAKFGDKNDFTAMWTPERHFYDFGGLYANPSITSAAISTITEKIKIRAGSVVSPLHSTIRIAEEWSMVDNLSNGRVAIAFAAGWQPNDFVIMPQNFEDRKNIMFNQIEEVQKLWQGQSVSFKNPNGKMIDINILPQPVQKKLPVWITAAGNPETFEMAGKEGYNLLTHLLGQSISEVSEKIKIYRKARKEAGHEGEGILTLMLHTFVGPDERSVKEIVREPMKNYLRSAVNLVKEAAWSFPTFKQATTNAEGNFSMDQLSSEDLDAILDYSFERYYQTSGLFGTPESCLRIVEELKQIGVDEIACLIDFGIDSDLVLAHLHYLNQLRIHSNKNITPKEILNESYSISSLIRKHNISHMQCTPSMAQMLVLDEESKDSLKSLQTILLGGEAFPVKLAKNLLEIVKGNILNMYGPTETTVWSTVYRLKKQVGKTVPIGKPIANTQIYLLDSYGQLVPVGIQGELCIGGDGVTEGYYKRPELTVEKFIDNPFSDEPDSKLYRTGDLAYYRKDGTIEFLGRLDHQVKIRGYRIELGEIETVLSSHKEIREAIVIAKEDIPGDVRLVAYVIPKNNNLSDIDEVKSFIKRKLPEYMLPSHYVFLNVFPLTPNGKIDRKAFPVPSESKSFAIHKDYVKPSNELELTIASVWQDLLKLPNIGTSDNFFDSGGHSLLAVQLHARLKKLIDPELTLIDIFTYPTISSLVEFVNSKANFEGEKVVFPESKRAEMSKQRISRQKSNEKKNSNDIDVQGNE